MYKGEIKKNYLTLSILVTPYGVIGFQMKLN